MAKNWEVESDKFIFFWGGVFSNWAKAKFRCKLWIHKNGGLQYQINGVLNGGVILDNEEREFDFNCSEQYMMAQKALIWEDFGALLMIMQSNNPKEQKAIGRTVKRFDVDKWREIARDRTYIGVYNKFLQNQDLQDLLLSTGNKWLVEASPLDNVWGIGFAPNDAANSNPENWTGKNWLGQVLMKVRDDIRRSEDSSFTKIDWTPYENERLL